MRVTKPQMRALKAIADARDPLEDGVLLMHCLPFRTVHAYKVVGSLSEKGLISQSGDGGIYLRLTESGRAVVAGRNCSGSAPAPREAVLATEKLVRDKLVHRIPNSECRVESDAECLDVLLREKLDEELGELRASAFRDVAEFADVVEVLYAIARRAGLSPVDIEDVRLAKLADRGGFEDGLVWTAVPDNAEGATSTGTMEIAEATVVKA